jgi:hypothetical protein
MVNLSVFHFQTTKYLSLQQLKVNNIDAQHKINRSEKDVPLTEVQTELDHTLIIETSVDVDEIAKLKNQFPKPAIIQSIFKLENTLEIDYELEIAKISTTNKKRSELIEILVELRKELFKCDTEAKGWLMKGIKERFEVENHGLSMEDRLKILSSGIFKLDEDVLKLDRYFKLVVSDLGEATSEEDANEESGGGME